MKWTNKSFALFRDLHLVMLESPCSYESYVARNKIKQKKCRKKFHICSSSKILLGIPTYTYIYYSGVVVVVWWRYFTFTIFVVFGCSSAFWNKRLQVCKKCVTSINKWRNAITIKQDMRVEPYLAPFEWSTINSEVLSLESPIGMNRQSLERRQFNTCLYSSSNEIFMISLKMNERLMMTGVCW